MGGLGWWFGIFDFRLAIREIGGVGGVNAEFSGGGAKFGICRLFGVAWQTKFVVFFDFGGD
jgi:hypothetical protein